MEPMEDASCRLLAGWKAIAQHLGVSVVTAKRWRRAGLPVHTPAGRSVLAFTVEINNWVRVRSTSSFVSSTRDGQERRVWSKAG